MQCWHCGGYKMRFPRMSEHECFQCDKMSFCFQCAECSACTLKGCEHIDGISICGVRFHGEEAADIIAKAKARWSEAAPLPEGAIPGRVVNQRESPSVKALIDSGVSPFVELNDRPRPVRFREWT
jgi:hypothetical protein